mgnify:CR=1 FL=1
MTTAVRNMPANANAPRYLSCAETAKLVRRALRESFPGVRFSVRSDTYSGGASIHVTWTDGPTAARVEPVAKTFAGAGFDGQQDMKVFKRHTLDGEAVHFGADFITCRRDISDAFRDQLWRTYWHIDLNMRARWEAAAEEYLISRRFEAETVPDRTRALAMTTSLVDRQPSPTVRRVRRKG